MRTQEWRELPFVWHAHLCDDCGCREGDEGGQEKAFLLVCY